MVLLQLRDFPRGWIYPNSQIQNTIPCHTEKVLVTTIGARQIPITTGYLETCPEVFIHNQMKYQADRDALRLKLRGRS